MKISLAVIGAIGVDVFGDAATRATDCGGRDVTDGTDTCAPCDRCEPYGCGAKLCMSRAEDDVTPVLLLASVVEASVVEASVVEASVVEASVVEASVVEASVVDASVVEPPVVEASPPSLASAFSSPLTKVSASP